MTMSEEIKDWELARAALRLLLFIVAIAGAAAALKCAIAEVVGWDERSTAELSLSAWAAAGRREVERAECFDERPRADGQVRCVVRFAGAADAVTVWCAGDHAHKKGCRWF